MFPCGKPVAVPEITVNKYGYFGLGEDDVRFARQFFNVLAEPKTEAM